MSLPAFFPFEDDEAKAKADDDSSNEEGDDAILEVDIVSPFKD